MEDKKGFHSLLLENKTKLHITQVTDVDTFDEGKIILYTEEDSVIVEGYDLHIQKLDVAGGELNVTGEIVSIVYAGHDGYKKGKGFFKRMLK
ncbi:MAG: sporulation protein YabP [Ruminococcaceae bacterium]|nr:sporulation protein YabP [Oscillospiraceae bacterium]